MEIENLLRQMLVLMIFMAVGFIAGKTGILAPEANRSFSRLLLNVTQPALILSAALNSGLSFSPADILRLIALSLVMYAVLIAVSYAAAPLFRTGAVRQNTFRFGMIFANMAFMGYPVVASLFGEDAVLIASIFCIPFNFLAYSLGAFLISGGEHRQFRWQVLLSSTMISTVLGIALVFLKPAVPEVFTRALDTLGDMTVPGAMMVIGATLSAASLKSVFGDAYAYLLCFVRLIVAPLAVWAVCRLFVSDSLYLGILTVMSAMPCAAISTMLCMEYGGDADTASRCVFLTTVLSVLTVPGMLWLLFTVLAGG